jgi:hypothetical protein
MNCKIKIYFKHSDNPDDQDHDTQYLWIYIIYVLMNISHQYTQLLFFNDSFIYVLTCSKIYHKPIANTLIFVANLFHKLSQALELLTDPAARVSQVIVIFPQNIIIS